MLTLFPPRKHGATRRKEREVPEMNGFSHVSLSVRDRDVSVGFYRGVLGFQELRTQDEGRWLRTICLHPSGAVVGFTQHRDRFNAVFDPRHAGVDHLAFGVPAREELERWEDRLAGMEVEHSPIVDFDLGSVLNFRDPDGFQLELFHLPTKPG